MDALFPVVKCGLYVIMAVSLLAALAAVLLRNIFHAALAFMITLLGVAGIFIALRADFLAAVQVLIYVGAVVTLIIFSIMMTEGLNNKIARLQNRLSLPAFAVCMVLTGIMIELVQRTPWPKQNSLHYVPVTAARLGESLMGAYVFPFEIISVFLIAALIGAVVVAKKDKDS